MDAYKLQKVYQGKIPKFMVFTLLLFRWGNWTSSLHFIAQIRSIIVHSKIDTLHRLTVDVRTVELLYLFQKVKAKNIELRGKSLSAVWKNRT